MNEHPLDEAETAYVVEPVQDDDGWVAWEWGNRDWYRIGETPVDAMRRLTDRPEDPDEEGEGDE